MSDPANPFDNSARANSWTPPLNETWRWGVDRIYGVNLGGLGTLIASIASLISYKIFTRDYPESRGRFLLIFTFWNLLFLLILSGEALLLS